jgi:hypothetical protein
MSFWKLIKGIKFKQLISLFKFFLKHPILMIATIKATSRTMKIVQEKFPDIHGENNVANAFRHALWNLLISFECLKREKNLEFIISWTKEITDWHEDFSPNKALARAMDLHNNFIGRELFLSCRGKSENEVIKELELKLYSAICVKSYEEIEENLSALVFIKSN